MAGVDLNAAAARWDVAAVLDRLDLTTLVRDRVDLDAVVAALDAGGLGGVALDVTEPEPLPAGQIAVGPKTNVLAYADRRGRVAVRDVDSDRVLWRSHGYGAPIRELQWSADRRRTSLHPGSSRPVRRSDSGALRRK